MVKNCQLCPRQCGINRAFPVGKCQSTATIKVARAAPHFWEEPCLSGTKGSGAVFFSGCSLGCVFCQNSEISAQGVGAKVSLSRLSEIFIELQAQGVHNINLVTAGHYYPWVVEALTRAKKQGLHIPIVWNTSSYETVPAVQTLAPHINIWLADLKFHSPFLSQQLAHAPDYFEVANAAVQQMCTAAGPPVFSNNGLLLQGLIIRLLVLPGQHKDALEILHWVTEHLPKNGFLLSLMSQYTPNHRVAEAGLPKAMGRKTASYEYNQVLKEAVQLGLTTGYSQSRKSANAHYTPLFDFTGVTS